MKRLLKFCTLFLLMGLCALSAFTASAEEVYEGVDVSVWQSEIDFSQVRDAGKEIVYIRAGEGMEEDLRFRQNAQGALDAGLKVGFYYFVTATDEQQALQQADYFTSLIQDYSYDCRPAVDYEQFGDLSREQINDVALAFAQRVEENTNVIPLFYTDYSNVETLWDESLGRYPLWVADYSQTDLGSLGPWDEWAGFQYYDQGEVAGIDGSVDLDRFTSNVLVPQSPAPPQTGESFPIVAMFGMACAVLVAVVTRYRRKDFRL